MLFKVHKKLGNSDQAMMNFSWAMELDPKGINNHDTGTFFICYRVKHKRCFIQK